MNNTYNSQLTSGLRLDSSLQQPNDVTFALNCIRDNHEGGRQEYQSEPGNELVYNLSKKIVGSIYGEDNEIYLFSVNDTESEIGLFKEGKYNPIVESDCLNFNLEHPITGEYRVRNGCEKVIYWCDKFNPDRFFNISKPDEFKTGGIFDCNKFKINSSVTVPNIDLLRVNDSGGSLPVGSYFFQVEILDTNENVIYSSDITPQTPIYDESQNQAYTIIDGALNIPQYDSTIGGVPTTTKSITLSISNLDTSFSFLRINVFRKIAATGAMDGHSVGSLIPLNSSSITYTYVGYNTSAGDFPIDVSEKLIDGITYESAYVMEQVQGRLLRANLKQTSIDYSTYQQMASRIIARWISTEHSSEDQFDLGNPKNPNTYWYKTGCQGDEVYLPGIQYLHTSGEWSPVFPLVGREANSNDTQLLTVVGNTFIPIANQVWESDVDHIDITEFETPSGTKIGNQIKRWKVFNTATLDIYDESVHPYFYSGALSYYETDETYPNIENCDGDLIWGDGITSNTKVRLFKFPDRKLLSHISDDGLWLRPFGFSFSNIFYPNADIIGHRFCIADRTEFDKTVLDSGWSVGETANLDSGVDTILTTGAYLNNTGGEPYIRFNSANTLFNQSLFAFDYYKLNKAYTFQSPVVASAPGDYFSKTLTTDGIVYSVIQPMSAQNNVNPKRTNLLEINSVLIEPGETSKFFSPIGKNIKSSDNYTGDTISLINYKVEDVSSIIGNSETLITASDSSTNTQLRVHNFYTYKKTNVIPYKSFLSRNYKYLHNNPVTTSDPQYFYGGDTLISNAGSFRQYQQLNAFYAPWYRHHFEEHDVNMELRVRGTENPFLYFRGSDDDNYNLNKSTDAAVILANEDRIPEYYRLNTDYTVDKFQKGKSTLSLQYDYCNPCQGNYPNRIVWSPKSFDEETFDLFRLNKVNDYLDLPAHRGEITGLGYQNNQLLVHTRETTFILQPNPQQISTDQNTAYLTTGDFLSIPPQEMIQSDIGMAGCQSKQAQMDTPFGRVWVDQNRGEIFKWDSKLDVLSNKGVLQWFKEYLPSELKTNFYNIYEKEFSLSSTLHEDGIGVIVYYDPRFKRLLFTKKDYKPINLVPDPTTISQYNTYYYNNQWYGVDNIDYGFIPVESSDPNYFENKSWTISYSLLDQSWTSWHSYTPPHVIVDNDNYYSFNNTSIYKHLHKTEYQKYYGTKYDMVVEFMKYDVQTGDSTNVHYVGFTQEWDNVNHLFLLRDATFNKLVVYNQDQSTGLQTLTLQNQFTNPYQNTVLPKNSKYVIKTDQTYKIAGLYDMSIGQPVMSKSWSLLQTYPGYIDKLVYTPNINLNKSMYSVGKIKDKIAFVRLFFNPTQDYKKTIVLEQLTNTPSIR